MPGPWVAAPRVHGCEPVDVGAPVSGNVDGAAVEHIAVIEAAPVLVGDAETLEQPPHSPARLPARYVVDARVETEADALAGGWVAHAAGPMVGEAARHVVLFEHRDPQAGVGEQRCGCESTDAGAHDGDVEPLLALTRRAAARGSALPVPARLQGRDGAFGGALSELECRRPPGRVPPAA